MEPHHTSLEGIQFFVTKKKMTRSSHDSMNDQLYSYNLAFHLT
jgi:hypothetical protein